MELTLERTVAITGGGGAIATAVAEVLSRAGARLALLDRPGVPTRAEELGAVAIEGDVADPESAAAALDAAARELGSVWGVVHTVGGFEMGPLSTADPDVYDRMFDVNTRTTFSVVHAALPRLLDAGDGFVAAISAGPGLTRSAPAMAAYGAAKSAVATLLRSVDEEIEGSAVRACVVYPMGVVDTAANRSAMPDADPATFIDPAEIGAALLFAATRSTRGRVRELAIYPPR